MSPTAPTIEHRDLVRDLCDIEEGLSEWEVGFVESIARRVEDGERALTARQALMGHAILGRFRDDS